MDRLILVHFPTQGDSDIEMCDKIRAALKVLQLDYTYIITNTLKDYTHLSCVPDLVSEDERGMIMTAAVKAQYT